MLSSLTGAIEDAKPSFSEKYVLQEVRSNGRGLLSKIDVNNRSVKGKPEEVDLAELVKVPKPKPPKKKKKANETKGTKEGTGDVVRPLSCSLPLSFSSLSQLALQNRSTKPCAIRDKEKEAIRDPIAMPRLSKHIMPVEITRQ